MFATYVSGLSIKPPVGRWQQMNIYSCNALTSNTGFLSIRLKYGSEKKKNTMQNADGNNSFRLAGD